MPCAASLTLKLMLAVFTSFAESPGRPATEKKGEDEKGKDRFHARGFVLIYSSAVEKVTRLFE